MQSQATVVPSRLVLEPPRLGAAARWPFRSALEQVVLVVQVLQQMVVTDNPEEADVILLNTCSIREKAQEKVFHELGRWKNLKTTNPVKHVFAAPAAKVEELKETP